MSAVTWTLSGKPARTVSVGCAGNDDLGDLLVSMLGRLGVEPQIADLKRDGYNPRSYYERSPLLREVLDGLLDGRFTNGDRDALAPLVNDLLNADRYCVLADFDAYTATQAEVGSAYRDIPRWSRMSLLNTARSGRFSSDRTIREYCSDIWNIPVA